MKKYQIRRLSVSVILLTVLLLCSTAISAASPQHVVRSSNNRVSAILQGHSKVSPAIEAKLKAIISRVTAFDEMSRMASAAFPATVKKQTGKMNKFRETFSKLLLVSSVNKMGRYRAKKYVFGRTVINGNRATVNTVAYYKNDKVDLVYKLKRINGKWMIVNYQLDGIDTIFNYKKQFAQMFRLGWSIDKIIGRLQSAIQRNRNS